MFVPAINAEGWLAFPVGPQDTVVSVDTVLWGYLNDAIAGGNHTYLQMGYSPAAEVVKVLATLSLGMIEISRGADNTLPRGFPAATVISYRLCADAIRDMVNAVASPTITIQGTGAIQVEEQFKNNFILTVPELALTSENGSIITTGTYPNVDVVVNPTANGCCG